MSSNFPLKELAIVGATTIGVCCLIGWLTGAENLDQKKKKGPQRSGEQPSECDVFINLAEGAMKKGALEDAIVAYSKALELAEANTEDPRLALYPLYIHRRLVEVYEKMEKPKEALIHLQECISFLEQNKSPATDELMALLTLLEQAVDLCTLSQAPRAVQEKLLHKWLAVAKQLQNVEYIVMAQMLLGRVNYLQDKLPEAEGFLRQVIESYTDPKAREDLWLNAMTTLLDCSTRLEKPEQAKECITQLADYHLENKFDKKALETLGDRCVYLGYYDEAEHILRATLKLLKTKGFPAIEHAQVDYNLAVVWSATGRLDIAREKINEMKEYLRTAPNSLIPSRSKFLHTQGAKHESDTTTIYLKRSPLLKTGSVLVVRFENPELETAFSEIEYIVKETDEVIKIAAPYNYANFLGQLSSAEVTIFTGEDKTIPLGTHFVFISSADTLPSQQSNPVSVANILASETLREQIDAKNPQALVLEALLRSMQEGEMGEMLGEEAEDDDEEGDEEEELEEEEEQALREEMQEALGELIMGNMGNMGRMGAVEDDEGNEPWNGEEGEDEEDLEAQIN